MSLTNYQVIKLSYKDNTEKSWKVLIVQEKRCVYDRNNMLIIKVSYTDLTFRALVVQGVKILNLIINLKWKE